MSKQRFIASRKKVANVLVATAMALSCSLPAQAFVGSPKALTTVAPIMTVDHDRRDWRRYYGDKSVGGPNANGLTPWRRGDNRRYYDRRRYYDHDDDDWRGWRRHRRDRDDLAAGIAGLAAGALLGGILGRNGLAPRGDVRVNAPPAAGYAPFSPGYMRHCSNKYRSFDPGTGTYLGYDGRRHFCR